MKKEEQVLPYVLICECSSREHQIIIEHDNEYNIANAIENSNIPDGEFDPYTKMGVVNFIKKGSASQSYLEEMMDILKKYDIEVELTPTTPLPDRNIGAIEDFNDILSKYLK